MSPYEGKILPRRKGVGALKKVGIILVKGCGRPLGEVERILIAKPFFDWAMEEK